MPSTGSEPSPGSSLDPRRGLQALDPYPATSAAASASASRRRPANVDPAKPVLAGLGVSQDEESAYRALLRLGPSSLAVLAGDLGDGTSETWLRPVVDRLVALGLVSEVSGRGDRFTPNPPEAAVEALAARRLREVNRSRAMTPTLVEEVLRGASTRPEDVLELVTGRDLVAQRYIHLFDTAQEEVRTLVRPPYTMQPMDVTHPQTTRRLPSELRVRTIYDPSAIRTAAEIEFLRLCVEQGEEARVGEVPIKLFVVDRRTAMLPLTAGGVVESSLVIHASALLDALLLLFDALWRSSLPFPPGGTTGAVAAGGQDGADGGEEGAAATRHTQVVTMLMAGLTDEAIARQLGVSSRTVQRDVRTLCDELGAVTRFQAGLKLGRAEQARRGVLR